MYIKTILEKKGNGKRFLFIYNTMYVLTKGNCRPADNNDNDDAEVKLILNVDAQKFLITRNVWLFVSTS